MINELQDVFINPETGSRLAYAGEFKESRWDNGILTSGTGESWPVIYGIPDFVGDPNDVFDNQCIREGWIQKNWRAMSGANNEYSRFAKEIADNAGVILEVAAGPSGGNATRILQYDSDAAILMNDISYIVLNCWRELLGNQNDYKNLSFAAFDIRKMPLKSESIDVISDFVGISNVDGDRHKAISEVYRILKPGGSLYSIDMCLVKEGWNDLPDYLQLKFEKIRQSSLEKLVSKSNFKTIESKYLGDMFLEPENNLFAKDAEKYGVELKAQIHQHVFDKPYC